MTAADGPALPAELAQLLRGVATCYLSTPMPDGSPQLTQTWVDTDGTDVLINTVTSHQKVKNIHRDPRVALTVSSTTNPSHYHEIRGHVSQMVNTGAEAHIEALTQRYLGTRYPRYGGPDQERLVLHISPGKINTMG